MFKKIKIILKNRISYSNGNEVFIHYENGKVKKNPFYIKGLKINFKGKNSRIDLFRPMSFDSSSITLYDNCVVSIKDNARVNLTISGYHESNVRIGKDVWIGGAVIHMENERGTTLEIENNAVLSYNIQIWTTDTHPIFDLNSSEMINNTKSTVHIGAGTWVCANTILLKNADISDNNIVGNGSVVTKKIKDENVVIAGNPAKIVKRNVYWRGCVIS